MIFESLLEIQDDHVIILNGSFPVYKDWIATGLAKTDAYFQVLGFTNSQQVVGFCNAVNVFQQFSKEEFIRSYSNEADASQIFTRSTILSGSRFTPFAFSVGKPAASLNFETKPRYEDFYLFLFTWLTHGDTPQNRKQFIDMCLANGTLIAGASLLNKKQWQFKTLRSFKDAVDKYLSGVKQYEDSIKTLNIGAINSKPVSQMTREEKVAAAIYRSFPLLPGEIVEELKQLLNPWVLVIIVVVLIAWAVSHFFGVGEIADVIIIIVGIVSLGPIAWQAGEQLVNFASKSVWAQTEADLDQAGQHLAKAISLVGVQVVMALLLKKAPKVFREPRNTMTSSAKPLTMKTVGEPPTTPGKIFYEPKTFEFKSPFPGGASPGMTNRWGDITVTITKNVDEVMATRIHEAVHRFLIPKLQVFKELRQALTILKTNSYLKSYILRYLEEALAQTISQCAVYGVNLRNVLIGLRFPVGHEGYVTLAKMGTEVTGILLGPINASGMACLAYFESSRR